MRNNKILLVAGGTCSSALTTIMEKVGKENTVVIIGENSPEVAKLEPEPLKLEYLAPKHINTEIIDTIYFHRAIPKVGKAQRREANRNKWQR